jgi:hypothetical protein
MVQGLRDRKSKFVMLWMVRVLGGLTAVVVGRSLRRRQLRSIARAGRTVNAAVLFTHIAFLAQELHRVDRPDANPGFAAPRGAVESMTKV